MLFACLLGAGGWIWAHQEAFKYRTVEDIQRSWSYFNDSQSGKLPEGLVLQEGAGEIQEIQIRFRMKVSEIDGYYNAFQTAPANSGVRLELARPSTLGLVVGHKNSQGFRAFILTNFLERNRWIYFRMTIDRSKNLRVFGDESPVLDVRDEEIQYKVSDFALGTGFSKTRPFQGKLADFYLGYKKYRKNPAGDYLVVGALFPPLFRAFSFSGV